MNGREEAREPEGVNEEPPARGDEAGEAERSADDRLAELEDRWLRAVADLDNTRKRAVRDGERARAEERRAVAVAWLPVVDNLELALKHGDGEKDAVLEGVRAVRDQAVGVLARLGYERHDETGVRFDPALHEAVATAPGEGAEPGTVLEVMRPGYGEGERQLRPAVVVVAAKAE
ncbi:nucleotide exchange factor GrpE [Spongiactinospora sp. TRM90649]|uniref:nucleotide exchange factor GrpE n=1 Tax=Spongiactinospora sp. TRM90649 TaxID=3031114 RepID=UPI0023F70FF4|nr:nucleotide exchange factor GrpE [Spongiactinospora sp. TRM90649]MDF5757970.1 nucleotide exchange factor GrpE [Spongiactinospora sp. TRM90649]